MEVTVVPSSSCYFSGEEASFDIIFTNSTTPSAVPRSHTHRRGHSISSAPLARPPTSPGVFGHKYTPSSPAAVPTTAPLASPSRRGIIGSPFSEQSPSNSRPKRSIQSKSLSSSLSKSEVVQLALGNSPASSNSRSDASSNSFPIHHPHARKQSVQWNTIESAPLNTSTSSYSLQLAPISESHSPSSPSFPSPVSPSLSRSAPPGVSGDTIKPMSRGLGIDFPSTTRADGRPGPRSASAGTLPIQGSETLLWAYAQVVGNFECDDRIVDSVVLASIRTKLTRSGPVGAGRMDLYDQTPGSTRGTGSGWSSFLGFRSPRATPPAPGSFFSGLFSNRSSPAMNNSSDTSGEAIPILVPSQIVLAVDLTLAPGESKTYTYNIRLPRVLPPTYRGRSFRISYSLVIGTCRGKSTSIDSQSRLLRIPIRIYNSVSTRDPSVQYNLLWPSTQLGTSEALAFVKDAQYQSKKESKTKGLDSIEGSELLKFSEDLLRSGPGAGETSSQVGDELEDNKSGDNSRLAVEILTRQAKTASFDVHRGGASFASLMLPKTTLRLGETVQGVVIFNGSLGSIRVVKLDCFLETYETLPEMLVATLPKKSGTRRVQSEQHSDMVLHLQRTSFSLDIPSDASPSFSIHLAGDKGNGGLEWKLRVCFLVCQEDSSMESVGPGGEWGNSFSAGDGSGLGQLETVECEIPVFVLPAHTVFGSTPVSFSI